MPKIKVLIDGYVRYEGSVMYASSTVTLIQDKSLNIIVDPGMDRAKLLKALKEEGLSVSDIDFVFLTHSHSDHILLAGIFDKAKVIDESKVYSWNGRLERHKGRIPGTNIKIIKTPGHDPCQATPIVDTKKYGKVAIASDLFWWADNEKQEHDRESLLFRKDPYGGKDEKLTRQSREKILEIADYIVPGHGQIFAVTK